MDLLNSLKFEAEKLRQQDTERQQMPPPAPVSPSKLKRKREQIVTTQPSSAANALPVTTQQSANAQAMSKRIEKLGLRSAEYYRNLTLTEGILRKRLTLIHNLIEARCHEGDREMRVLLPEVVLDDSVRTALRIQNIEIDAERQPGDCVCGETQCEGAASGCILPGYYISYKGKD